MLRPRAARRPLWCAPPQRQLWSYATDLLTWIGLSRPDASDRSRASVNSPPPPPPSPPLSASRLAHKRVLRPQPPVDATFPTFQRPLDPLKRKGATAALGHFLQRVKQAPTAAQLLETWQTVAQCRPFWLPRQPTGRLDVRLAAAHDVGVEDRPWMLQLVPTDVFLELSAGTLARSMVVGTAGADLNAADVVVANETLVVGNLVQAFHDLHEHELVVAFFDAYDSDRRVWLQEHSRRAAADGVRDDGTNGSDDDDDVKVQVIEKRGSMEEVTQLPHVVYSCYLRSLATLKQSKKIVQLLETDERQLERLCSTLPNLHLILHACHSEKNGELARRAIDTISAFSPAAAISLGCYELAIRANLRDRKRGERELLSAIHLSRALLNDAGYILKPDIWAGLIKVSMCMHRPDLALEVFKTYPRHCIPEYQDSFRQVLLSACRYLDSTALEMMHFCWTSHEAKTCAREEQTVHEDGLCLDDDLDGRGSSTGTAVQAAKNAAANKEAETVLLNAIFWQMLNQRHAVSSLVQVVDIMEATRSKAGAMALERAVLRMLTHDMSEKNMSPRAAIESSLKFWAARSSVLCGQGFLVRLLLKECVKHEWTDECEMLLDHVLDVSVARVPIHSIIKLMETNESRGRFDVNARIGDKLLQGLSPSNRQKLRDDFYERYLMSCLRLEQFDKVGKVHVTYNLERRYPFNDAIRTIAQDAAAQCV
ncbi:unnamed protein product [Hyaloperonospora brassicae]|uniref:Pentacotripeptide-repeat region of PRORP domain-containing protein n=1 Tax=Hyaloperonospora brassicae TaxID=162125 RepID=A0AAV0TU08_HYABA|nr:unnamed protein product [Hyaloperonospora brassicae]